MGNPRTRAPYKPGWKTRIPPENLGQVEPLKAKCRYSAALIAETKEVWQPYYARRLTDEDAREIIENIVGFMDALASMRDEHDSPVSSLQGGSN